MKRLLAPIVVALSIAGAGCGGDDSDSDASAPSGTRTEATGAEVKATAKKRGDNAVGDKAEPAGSGLTIKTSDSEFGTILFDGADQAIYLFDKESSPTSECYGACAEAWPPVLTKGAPEAGAGVTSSLLGTTKRDDGSTQVTYKGQPLYYYVDDGPGQVLCHDVLEFGGLWLVVQPNGDAVAPS